MDQNLALHARYRLHPAYHLAVIDPNKVIVRTGVWSGQSMVFRDAKETGILAAVMTALDGTHVTEAILNEYHEHRESVAELLTTLLAKSIIDAVPDASAASVPETLAASLNFLSMISRQPADVTSGRLREAHVAVFGTGALGSRLAAQLAQSGIGALTLADARAVTATDLQTSMLFPAAHDGVNRADSLAKVLNSRFPATAVRSISDVSTETARQIMAEATLAVAAFDTPDPSLYHMLNKVALAARKPWSLVTLDAMTGLIGPMIVPFESPCYACYEMRLESNLLAYDPYVAAKNAVLAHTGGFIGLSGMADMLAGLAGYDAIRFVTTGYSLVTGKLLRFDFQNAGVETNDILKLPRCPACGKAARGKANQVALFTLDRLVEELGV
jgi:thiazole/oxazole-forming peptide maturase SagC family component